MADESTTSSRRRSSPPRARSSRARPTRCPPGRSSARSASAPATPRCWRAWFRTSCGSTRTSPTSANEGGQRFAAAEGWLEVFANRVVVLVGEANDPGSLDSGDLKSRLEDAEQRLEEAEEDSAQYKTAQMDKARAEAFLEIAEG